jgi:hypothetical protein
MEKDKNAREKVVPLNVQPDPETDRGRQQSKSNQGVHLGFAGMDVAYFIGSFVIQNQGDQMSL